MERNARFLERLVVPELLDELPARDDRAIRSRRDLRRLNKWLGNADHLARLLGRARTFAAERAAFRLVELGAGDGTFLLKVLSRLELEAPNPQAWLVDKQDIVAEETIARFNQAGWPVRVIVQNVFDFLEETDCEATVMVANLFLHHFKSEDLARLLSLASARTEVFAACEPLRSRWGLAACRFLWLLGYNSVTRYDAPASVRAGFLGNELSRVWPKTGDWRIFENKCGFGTHGFLAERIG